MEFYNFFFEMSGNRRLCSDLAVVTPSDNRAGLGRVINSASAENAGEDGQGPSGPLRSGPADGVCIIIMYVCRAE
jgi:hypothetical protein